MNIFKYEALKNTWEHMLNYLKNYKKKSLINIRKKDEYCFIRLYVRHINPQEKNPNRIKIGNKKLFTEIYKKLKDFRLPLEINKTNIKNRRHS